MESVTIVGRSKTNRRSIDFHQREYVTSVSSKHNFSMRAAIRIGVVEVALKPGFGTHLQTIDRQIAEEVVDVLLQPRARLDFREADQPLEVHDRGVDQRDGFADLPVELIILPDWYMKVRPEECPNPGQVPRGPTAWRLDRLE